MLGNKESLDQIIVATPGLSSDPIALGKYRKKFEEMCSFGKGEARSKKELRPCFEEALLLRDEGV